SDGGDVAGLPHPLRRTVEHVYLTDSGGTPLVHLSRHVPSDKDPDLVASMFTAIQNFMDDSFHSMGIGDVRSTEMGDRHHAVFDRATRGGPTSSGCRCSGCNTA